MNATLSDARFDDADWIFEGKLDGFRLLAFVGSGEARLLTRNRIRHRFPEIEAALLAQGLDDFIVDGEVVWGHRRTGAPRAAGAVGAECAVFDILPLEGHDVTPLPLTERKRLLREHFEWPQPLVLIEPLPEAGVAAYERARREGWEGVMAKRRDSVYEHKRSRNWLKMKCDAGQDFVRSGRARANFATPASYVCATTRLHAMSPASVRQSELLPHDLRVTRWLPSCLHMASSLAIWFRHGTLEACSAALPPIPSPQHSTQTVCPWTERSV